MPDITTIRPTDKSSIGKLNSKSRAWLDTVGFKAAPGTFTFLPDSSVVAVPAEGERIWSFANLPMSLPEGHYRLELPGDDVDAQTDAALGWALGSYEFTRYRKAKRAPAKLASPAKANRAEVKRIAESVFLARDLINTPCEDMGPAHLADAAVKVAKEFGAKASLLQLVKD